MPNLNPVNISLYAVMAASPARAIGRVRRWNSATPSRVSPNKMKSTGIPKTSTGSTTAVCLCPDCKAGNVRSQDIVDRHIRSANSRGGCGLVMIVIGDYDLKGRKQCSVPNSFCLCSVLQSGPRALGIGQGYAPGSGGAALRCHSRHSNLVRLHHHYVRM